MPWISERATILPRTRIQQLLVDVVAQCRRKFAARLKRVLLLPPDITRMHSGSGWVTETLYQMLQDEADIHVIPTLGQHEPHTREQNRQMFGSIPHERIHAHDWRRGCMDVGEVSAEVVKKASGGLANWAIPIHLNKMLMEQEWDAIINIGHVVPHEVLGFANHNKNYFIGLGGKDTICKSHLMAATCGIENNLGSLVTPLRHCFNRAEEEFLDKLPDVYIQLVLARDPRGRLIHTGFYAGDDVETYMAAARQAREQNITILDKPLERVVCVMQGDEFFSTWVANKAVYRTRMAIADGGELIIIAPGLKRFGEQPEVDAFIRKYGYCGTKKVMEQYKKNADMQDLAHATAHLIHGSSEGRFTITYAPGHLSRTDIEQVGFNYLDLQEALRRYPIARLHEGWQESAGERFYFIPTPSAGLWATREKLGARV